MTAVLLSYQYKEGKKLKPKPNYNSVDLSEVEWEDTEEKVSITLSEWCNQRRCECVMAVLQLRTAMVQGQTGTLSLDVRSSVDKGVSKDDSVDFTIDLMH